MTIGEALLGQQFCRHTFITMTETGVRCTRCWERVPSKKWWQPIGDPHHDREVADAYCARYEMEGHLRPGIIYRTAETDDGLWQVERGFR